MIPHHILPFMVQLRCTKITCLEAKDDTPSIGRNNEIYVHKPGTRENQVTVSKALPGK